MCYDGKMGSEKIIVVFGVNLFRCVGVCLEANFKERGHAIDIACYIPVAALLLGSTSVRAGIHDDFMVEKNDFIPIGGTSASRSTAKVYC